MKIAKIMVYNLIKIVQIVHMRTVSPRQVARAIGVSEASIKRWCDKGLIPVDRTAGGHRRLSVDQVLAFLREKKLPDVHVEHLGLPSLTGRTEATLKKALVGTRAAILRGDREGFERVVLDLYLAGESMVSLADQLIAPIFSEIGHQWKCGEVEVYEERLGYETCRDILARLRTRIPAPNQLAPLALGGTLSGDLYELPTALVELALREAGWNAVSLGSNLPFETVERAIEKMSPKLIWVSSSFISNEDGFVEGFSHIYEKARLRGIAVAVGGQALTPDVRSRIRYTAFCENIKDLIEFSKAFFKADHASF
jgi:methanogenic corrinoid protein MtbC1